MEYKSSSLRDIKISDGKKREQLTNAQISVTDKGLKHVI